MGNLDMLMSVVTVVAQFGMAAGAWRLANQLKARVDDHEHRIKTLESKKRRRR